MASRREVRCSRCGLRMLVQPDAQAVKCSSCRIIIKLRPLIAVLGHINNNRINGYNNNNNNNNNNAYGNDYPRPNAGYPRPNYNNNRPLNGNNNNNNAGYGNGYPRPNYNDNSPINGNNVEYGDDYPRPSYRPPASQMVVAPPRPMTAPPSGFGRKRAVVCGINYIGKSYSLKGGINDARSMKSFLIQYLGFPDESIIMLTEEEQSPKRIPTKENIRRAMRWLVKDCGQGDSLLFYFSGHGSRQKDYNGDEPDGQDEALCPLDHETEGKIIDDEINQTMVWPLLPGVKLHAVIDACYSGTILDLPFFCRMNRDGSYNWENHTTHIYKGTKGGLAFCLSACDDHQTSGDTTAFTGKNTGVMTHCFIKAAKSEPGLTYGRLLTLMRMAAQDAKSGIGIDSDEEPQLSSSEQFELYSRKFLL